MEYSELQESFWAACERGDNTAISWFVKLGADVTAQNNYAIIWAAENGHTETVKLLVNLGADVTAHDNQSIIWAAENSHTDTAKLLVQLGADVEAAIRWAKVMNFKNTVKILEEGLNGTL